MSELEMFLSVHEGVVETLAAAAEGIPAGREGFKPCEKCLSWSYLISHHGTNMVLMGLLMEKGKDHGFPGIYTRPEHNPATGPAAGKRLREVWGRFREQLQAGGDALVEQILPAPWAGGTETRVMEWLWWLHVEGVHHRGQAWIYARMNGVRPPELWGTEDFHQG